MYRAATIVGRVELCRATCEQSRPFRTDPRSYIQKEFPPFHLRRLTAFPAKIYFPPSPDALMNIHLNFPSAALMDDEGVDRQSGASAGM